MKRIELVVVAAIVITVAAAGAAHAASLTPAVTATGTVASTCASAVGGNITFPIDPSLAGPITSQTTDAGNASPTVKCTNGQVYAVSCTSSGILTVADDGVTDPINYSITGCPVNITGQGFGTATAIDFGLSLAAVDYQNAQVGAHSDIITITITY